MHGCSIGDGSWYLSRPNEFTYYSKAQIIVFIFISILGFLIKAISLSISALAFDLPENNTMWLFFLVQRMWYLQCDTPMYWKITKLLKSKEFNANFEQNRSMLENQPTNQRNKKKPTQTNRHRKYNDVGRAQSKITLEFWSVAKTY